MELGVRDGPELESARGADQLDAVPDQALHAAAAAAEPRGGYRIQAHAALLVRGRGAQDDGPLWPRVVRRAVVGRLRQDLQLVDLGGALPVHGAEAIGPRIAAADDHHALPLRGDRLLAGEDRKSTRLNSSHTVISYAV